MTKYEFKQSLENLLHTYFSDNQNKKDLPYGIDFDYIREEPNKHSYGAVTFRTEKKDTSFKIKAITFSNT